MILACQCLQFPKMAKNAIFRVFNPLFLENLTLWKVLRSVLSAQKTFRNTWNHLICKTHAGLCNWSLQPLSQDYDLATHTTYVVCINFIHEWQDLQFKVDFERQIFVQLFIWIYLTHIYLLRFIIGYWGRMTTLLLTPLMLCVVLI